MNRRTLTASLTTLAATLLLVAPLSAAPKKRQGGDARHAKLDSQLRQTLQKAPTPQRVIVRVKPGHEAALQKALTAHGDVVVRQHRGLGTMTVVLHGEDLAALAGDPAVLSVSSDARVRVQAAAQDHGTANGNRRIREARGNGNNVTREITGPIRTLQGLIALDPKGQRIGVAVIDSGIEDSSFFTGRISKFYDFTQGGIRTQPYDDFGHGTHVASLIGGSGQLDGGYQGMAPMVQLIGLKVLDRYGNGRTSDVIDAIMFAADNRGRLGVDIINLSLGHPIFESAGTDPLVRAVEYAVKKGIVVVASAGNVGTDPETREVGYGGLLSPGNAPSAITVGAADTRHTLGRGDDRVASFSSRGPSWIDGFAKPDLVAPGVGEAGKAAQDGDLYLLYPQLTIAEGSDVPGRRRFSRLSGTSMAAAEVSGLVAVMLGANPGLAPKTIKAILEYTATPIADDSGKPYDRLTQGAGELNGRGAIDMARALDPSMPVGTAWVDVSTLAGQTMFDGIAAAWSEHIAWGNDLIDGSSLLVHSEAWDDENLVWGNFCRGGDNIVWGNFTRDRDDNIVWGNVLWKDNIVWGNSFFAVEDGDNIVWGNLARDNIVWGNINRGDDGDNLVWGSSIIGF